MEKCSLVLVQISVDNTGYSKPPWSRFHIGIFNSDQETEGHIFNKLTVRFRDAGELALLLDHQALSLLILCGPVSFFPDLKSCKYKMLPLISCALFLTALTDADQTHHDKSFYINSNFPISLERCECRINLIDESVSAWSVWPEMPFSFTACPNHSDSWYRHLEFRPRLILSFSTH